MKKIPGSLMLCLVIGGAILFLGCVERETEFSLKSWEVIDDNGVPTLVIPFSASDEVRVELKNPEGVLTSGKRIEKGVSEAKMDLAGYREIPKAGRYTIVVKDKQGNTLFAKEISFTGAKVLILECTPTWKGKRGKYTLDTLTISVKNEGDLPAYIGVVEIHLQTPRMALAFAAIGFKEVILPGEEKEIMEEPRTRDIRRGGCQLAVSLEDSSRNTLATYTTKLVTP
jgi:hypothetical protein